jgi:hypothetical protein
VAYKSLTCRYSTYQTDETKHVSLAYNSTFIRVTQQEHFGGCHNKASNLANEANSAFPSPLSTAAV